MLLTTKITNIIKATLHYQDCNNYSLSGRERPIRICPNLLNSEFIISVKSFMIQSTKFSPVLHRDKDNVAPGDLKPM
jgi:hypothetical protein